MEERGASEKDEESAPEVDETASADKRDKEGGETDVLNIKGPDVDIADSAVNERDDIEEEAEHDDDDDDDDEA